MMTLYLTTFVNMRDTGVMNIQDWCVGVTGKDSVHAIADKAGIPPTTLYSQVKGEITPTSAVKIARAYHRPPTEPLIIMGLLTQEDVDALASSGSLTSAGDAELIRELARRLGVDDGGEA